MHAILVAALLAAAPPRTKPCDLYSFAYISSYTENSALTAERCRQVKDPNHLHCTFVELNLTPPPPDEELKSKVERDRAEWRNATINPADYVKACKGPESQESWIKAQLALTKPEAKRRILERSLASWRQLCACQTADCIREAMVKEAELDRRMCKVRFQKYELDLKRTAPNRWVSTSGPSGICDSVEVTTVELDPESCLATVTWVRASANLGDQFCQGLQVNVPTVWSWKSEGKMAVKCDAVQFTP